MKISTKKTFQIYWNHVKKYKLIALLMTISITISVIIDVALPLFLKRFFDVLTSSDGLSKTEIGEKLIGILLTILLLNGIGWLLWRFNGFANNFFQPRVMADLMNSSFEYLQKHSFGFFINQFVGSLVRKVNRFVQAFERITEKVYWDLFPMAIRVIAILIVLFYHNVIIAVILMVWTVVYVGINYGFSLYKLKYDVKRAEIDSEVTGRLADTITNNANIKLFTALKNEIKRFKELTEKQFKINRFTWNLSDFNESIQAALMIGLEFTILYVAIRFWQKGVLSIGDFVLLQAYMVQMFLRLWDFGRIIKEVYERLADAEEMTGIFMKPHDVIDKPRASELIVDRGKVEFKEVGFNYAKTRQVIKNFNLTIKPGEKVGIVGPSGAGKSTLVVLLFRFYDLTDGKIFIDGQKISNVTQESLRRNMSLVPQDPLLFHRTLTENIRFGNRSASIDKINDAAKQAHCDEFIENLPEKYDTYVGERGVKLSGGERQRVAIARAICKNAPILILDEATSSLDSHSELLIQDALAALMKGKTTIVIAHRLSTIMKMDRIVVIDKGEIKEIGTHDALLQKKGGIYQRLWNLQAGGFIS